MRLTGRQCDQKLSTGDSCFIRKLKKTTTQVLFLNLYTTKSIRYGGQYTTHLSVPSKIMSEYYKIFKKIECISTRMLILHSQRAILFQWLLLKLGSQAYFNTVCFSFAVKMEAVTNQLKELRERKVSRKAS